ncbi:hypothetical protein CLOACE_05740 [Clostridium acetireducens DSM 10703]|jgi:hypothetical protein|uniref:Dipeptidyl-peptidase IV n=1 Tax=Clostridium acetireducens DSM 10703 TaxID=1121290 RepID=A0A1E8F0P6_9CLOT|nr:hypothetical protein [Clostridium acetireducens]OFI06988.1 hypothetical protein CLOACE_05740 [Clostridium acetireducens DSM 10703]
MKVLKRLFKWTLVPIVIVALGLFIVDKFYLSEEMNFNIKKVSNKQENKIHKINVPVDQEAKYIKISYRGKYAAYYKDNVIKIINTETKDEKTIDMSKSVDLPYYKWLPDRDILLIGEKCISDNKGYFLKFISYDAKRDESFELSDNNNNKVLIPLSDKSYDITDTSASTSTHIMYIKISNIFSSKIYRINIMSQLETIENITSKVGKISIVNREDKLIYEDRITGTINLKGYKNNYPIDTTGKLCLLSVDNEDTIYVGNKKDTKKDLNNPNKDIFVNEIWHKQLNSNSTWNKIALEKFINKKNIYISKNGNIYVDYKDKGLIKELKTGKETFYKGKFVGICDYGIVSLYEGKLVGSKF